MYSKLYQLMRYTNRREWLTQRYMREFERNQWLSQEELNQVSWNMLKKLLDHAYQNVPFYQEHFKKLGLTPQDIKSEEDFRQFPFLTKDDIRKNSDGLIAKNYAKDKMTRKATSGSTGVPLVLYRDLDYNSADVAAFTRARRWFGYELGDKIAWIWGRRDSVPAKMTLKQMIKRERWFDGYRPTPETLQEYAETLLQWQPTIIAGYGNVIYVFAEYLANQNITGIRPKVIETTGMTIWPHERQKIEEVFQCPVSDRYSSHEAGAIISAECPHGNKHIFNDFCYVEIIKDGRPAAPGEMGEVIITPLHSFGMPLIRYQMADIATFADSQCSCGRGLPILRDLVGRTTSIFTLPSGKFLYGGVFRHLALKDTIAIEKFRVHQYTREKIEVFLQKGEGFNNSVVDLIRSRCQEVLGDEPVELKITVTDDMDTTSSGKFLVTSSDVPITFN